MWRAAFVLLVAGASAECADGVCEDSVLMQMQRMQGKMTQQQKQAMENKIEPLGWRNSRLQVEVDTYFNIFFSVLNIILCLVVSDFKAARP